MKRVLFCFSLVLHFLASGQVNLGMQIGSTTARILEPRHNRPTTSATLTPIASFSVWANCVGQTIKLNDTSLNSPTNWTWTATGAMLYNPYSSGPTAVAFAVGTITVTLIVSNSAGKDTLVKTIQIYPLPQISIVSSRTYICRGEIYTLTAFNNAIPTFTWNGSIVSPTLSTYHNGPMGTYTQFVSGIDTMGCRRDTAYYVKVNSCSTLSTNDFNEIDNVFKIYPNPCKDNIVLEVTTADLTIYKIVSLTGDIVQEAKIEPGVSGIIDLTKYLPGIYFLHLNLDGKTITKKIVISD